jgi:hypothetical protein
VKLIAVTSSALFAGALFFSGCSVPASGNITSDRVLTGNWQFIPIDDFYHNDILGGLAGSLSSQGNSITGIFRSSGGCVSPTQDIHFTGTEDAKGNLTLTSTNLPDNQATISGSIQEFPSETDIASSLVVTGSGPCAMAPYPGYMGIEDPPLSGTYTANLTSSSGATATLTANLVVAAVNSDGEFPETGTLTLTTSGCSATFSLNGVMTGSSLQATLTPASGSANGATFSDSGSTVTINNPGTGCASGSFTGTLLSK